MSNIPKINEDAIKFMLGRLDKPAFTKFVFELFGQHDFQIDHEPYPKYEYQKTYYIKKFGENIIEQNYVERKIRHRQGYNLIVPFLVPFELIKNTNNFDVGLNDMIQLFKYYRRITNNRYYSWYFPQDGDYIVPGIKFITNYSDFDDTIYEENLIPKFEKFIERFDIDNQVFVGSIDTIFSGNREGTLNAFDRFISKYNQDISICLHEDKFKVQRFINEKYFKYGVLKDSLSPCEPVISVNDNLFSHIITEFEFLLNKDPRENELESFLKKYYRYIFSSQYNRIETQIWLKFPDLDINKMNRRLDVLLRNSIEGDWELFELKRANNIVKNVNNIPAFTSDLNLAVQQLRSYKKLLEQDSIKYALAKDGIEYYHPELRLVIGKTPNISSDQWRWLKKSNENDLKIMTYDDLLKGLKSTFEFHTHYNPFNL
jgi:hypothetical protein